MAALSDLARQGNLERNAGLRQQGLEYGIEFTHPFWDRRLIESALAVPAYTLALPYRKKRLLHDRDAGSAP